MTTLTTWLNKLSRPQIYPYIDHFQSMTIFFVIDHGQWQFFCHWPGSMTLFWALSISFCHWLWSMTYGHKWYVHKVEWFSALSNSQWDQGCQKIVIYQSMTIFCDNPFLMEAKIVIDWSMTFLEGCFKTVIDRSMTIFYWYIKTVIDWSMTVPKSPHSNLIDTLPKMSLTGQGHLSIALSKLS